mmetsp:Transcript_2197/g.5068  ORF Transcript_2197/g.5068 Transcript_2197/m.5068 type:complete len:298 (+) Transcript_2197:32-925(+)
MMAAGAVDALEAVATEGLAAAQEEAKFQAWGTVGHLVPHVTYAEVARLTPFATLVRVVKYFRSGYTRAMRVAYCIIADQPTVLVKENVVSQGDPNKRHAVLIALFGGGRFSARCDCAMGAHNKEQNCNHVLVVLLSIAHAQGNVPHDVWLSSDATKVCADGRTRATAAAALSAFRQPLRHFVREDRQQALHAAAEQRQARDDVAQQQREARRQQAALVRAARERVEAHRLRRTKALGAKLHFCPKCKEKGGEQVMCNYCGAWWHTACVRERDELPVRWFCANCYAKPDVQEVTKETK